MTAEYLVDLELQISYAYEIIKYLFHTKFSIIQWNNKLLMNNKMLTCRVETVNFIFILEYSAKFKKY